MSPFLEICWIYYVFPVHFYSELSFSVAFWNLFFSLCHLLCILMQISVWSWACMLPSVILVNILNTVLYVIDCVISWHIIRSVIYIFPTLPLTSLFCWYRHYEMVTFGLLSIIGMQYQDLPWLIQQLLSTCSLIVL